MKTRSRIQRAGVAAACAIGLIAPTSSPAKQIDVHTTVFVANRDSSDITMIDVRTDEIVGRIPLGDLVNPHMAMVTPDGKRLLVAGTKRNAALIVDLASQQVTARIPVGTEPEHFDITEDGKVALMGNLEEGTVSVLDLERGTEVKRLNGFAEPHGFAFPPGGRKAYVSSFGAPEVAAVDADRLEVAR